jgi:hypothetical protein
VSSLISNQELTLKLELHMPKAAEINIISAFITKPAYSWLCNLTQFNTPKITLVGRFLPKDFIDGASNIEAIRLSLISGYSVKALSNLHAKIFQIDNDMIYTGSANMTGKGLALIEKSNLEACTKVAPNVASKLFITKVINSSIELTLEHLDRMQKFIDGFTQSDNLEIPENWPNDILPKTTVLFVSDFPLSKPEECCEIYGLNPSLEFAVIEKNKSNFEYAQSLFKNSKAYSWLKTVLLEHEGSRDPGFGQISNLLHDALCDDPAPYRRDIKDIQANMYKYLTLYAADEIEIYMPGRRSQVLKLLTKHFS